MYELLIISIVIGFMNAGFIHWLDLLMTKGHALDFVREWAARRAARKGEIEELFDTLPEFETWEQRADIYNQLYWNIAKTQKRFTRWICPYCMSAYTFFPVAALILYYGSWSWYEIGLIVFFSLITNYLFIKWLA